MILFIGSKAKAKSDAPTTPVFRSIDKKNRQVLLINTLSNYRRLCPALHPIHTACIEQPRLWKKDKNIKNIRQRCKRSELPKQDSERFIDLLSEKAGPSLVLIPETELYVVWRPCTYVYMSSEVSPLPPSANTATMTTSHRVPTPHPGPLLYA